MFINTISESKAKTFKECQLKYRYKYVDRFKEEAKNKDALHFGSYIHKIFDKTHELISCMGNITLKDEEPFIHAHITFGDHDMNVKGGHVFAMTVAVVGEFYIRNFDGAIHRELNGDIGLAVCRIGE